MNDIFDPSDIEADTTDEEIDVVAREWTRQPFHYVLGDTCYPTFQAVREAAATLGGATVECVPLAAPCPICGGEDHPEAEFRRMLRSARYAAQCRAGYIPWKVRDGWWQP